MDIVIDRKNNKKKRQQKKKEEGNKKEIRNKKYELERNNKNQEQGGLTLMNEYKENNKNHILNSKNQKDMIKISGFKETEHEIWISTKEWFHPIIIKNETISNNSDPNIKILEKLIIEWKNHAKELEKSFHPTWYVKCASIRFLYHDKMYQLFPSAIETNSELFEYMADEIEQKLKEIGCPYVRYEGTID